MNRWQEAIESFGRARSLQPNSARARIALCMGQLPVIYEDEAQVGTQREAYARQLQMLCDDVERGALDEFAKEAGSYMPFFLAYQGQSDRELQARYGALVCRAMGAQYGAVPLAPLPVPAESVRDRHRHRLLLAAFGLEDSDQRLGRGARPQPLPCVWISHRIDRSTPKPKLPRSSANASCRDRNRSNNGAT